MPTILVLAFLASGIQSEMIDGCDHQPDRRHPRVTYEILQSGTELGLGFQRRWFVVRVQSVAKASRAELAEILDHVHDAYGRKGTWTTVAFQALLPTDDLDAEPEGWAAEVHRAFALGVVRPDGLRRDLRIGTRR
jgi:hypothetical protein